MKKFIEYFAQFDGIFRPLIIPFPNLLVSRIYSPGRKLFVNMLASANNIKQRKIPSEYSQKIWELNFQSPIYNAAGIFKNGDGYRSQALQGAGAFLIGTTTSKARIGNKKHGITHPFLPLPSSKTAINWMGLPNYGHFTIAKKIASIDKIIGCPICASLGYDPDMNQTDALPAMLEGLIAYSKAGCDFIEINESCPNVAHVVGEIDKNGIDTALLQRAEYISSNFLKNRNRKLPVVLKFSNDTDIKIVPAIIDLLIDLGFDGINFGNTSTDYGSVEKIIAPNELKIFKEFTRKFGGGVSGLPLKEKSLNLVSASTKYLSTKNLSNEFVVVRTGGIETIDDIELSKKNGVVLNQWFTGYFELFSKNGFDTYQSLFNSKSETK